MSRPLNSVAVLALIAASSLFPVPTAAAQALTGPWTGHIAIAGSRLDITVTFAGTGDAITATIDIPQQGARGLALKDVRVDGDQVHFELPAGPGVALFDGQRVDAAIAGDFTQSGIKGRFELTAGPAVSPATAPTTRPVQPKPYAEESITVASDGVELACTVTVPPGKQARPGVVLLSGSGPQDRNATLFSFQPFAILADRLGRAGFASLRCDDRGVGASTGKLSDTTLDQLAGDATALAVRLAAHPNVDGARVGLLGHSEGAMIAPLAAAKSKSIRFVILMAPPAVPSKSLLRDQAERLGKAGGLEGEALAAELALHDAVIAAAVANDGWDEARARIEAHVLSAIAKLPEASRANISSPADLAKAQADSQLAMANTPWFRHFVTYDPTPALAATSCPVLALFADNDQQVAPDLNRPALQSALGDDQPVTIRTISGANHLFQASATGHPREYAELAPEFAPGVIDSVLSWLQALPLATE